MTPKFAQLDDGDLRIWRMPEPGMMYTLGVDASTGLAEDNSGLQVLTNTIPFIQVARMKLRLPVNRVTEYVNLLGRFYNEALLVCEINYPGNSVQDALLQFYQYPRNYQTEQRLHEDPNVSPKYGFRTTETTKWMLIHELQQAIEADEILIYDADTLYELHKFVYQAGPGKAGAAEGYTDDLVMSLMLALHGAKLYPFLRPVKPEEAPRKQESKDPQTRADWRRFREVLYAKMEHKISQEAIL